MPLVKSKLKTQIKNALEVGLNANKESDPNAIMDDTAGKLADAIHAYITSASVDVTLLVASAATPVPVPVTGKGIGTIK